MNLIPTPLTLAPTRSTTKTTAQPSTVQPGFGVRSTILKLHCQGRRVGCYSGSAFIASIELLFHPPNSLQDSMEPLWTGLLLRNWFQFSRKGIYNT